MPVEVLRGVEGDDLEDTLLRIGQILVRNVLRPNGQRLLRLTNAVATQMPEIAAFNVQKGTEPTLAYLADLFRRRLGPDGMAASEAADAAEAFSILSSVVRRTSPLAVSLWTTPTSNGTPLHRRTLPARCRAGDKRRLAVEQENIRLRNSMEEALAQLDAVRDQLQRGCYSLIGPDRYFSSAERDPSSRRAMISCWICWVPSKMSRIFESRAHFSSSVLLGVACGAGRVRRPEGDVAGRRGRPWPSHRRLPASWAPLSAIHAARIVSR